MKKVCWIQLKTCDVISQAFLHVIFAIQILSQMIYFYSKLFFITFLIINRFSGEKIYKPANNSYLNIIDWNKNQEVLEQI